MLGFIARLIAPRDFTDESVLRFHRTVEYAPLLAVLAAALAAAALTDGPEVEASFMPTVAQIIPVLYIAQLVDNGFFAQRLAAEVGDRQADRALAHHYVGETARSAALAFLLAESAALYGAACGATTFTIVVALGVGVSQVLDLALGVGLKGAFRPTALGRMIERRNRAES
jgi:hypothetical protein